MIFHLISISFVYVSTTKFLKYHFLVCILTMVLFGNKKTENACFGGFQMPKLSVAELAVVSINRQLLIAKW